MKWTEIFKAIRFVFYIGFFVQLILKIVKIKDSPFYWEIYADYIIISQFLFLLIITFIEIGIFLHKNINIFIKTTQFIENIEEISRLKMFALCITTSIFVMMSTLILFNVESFYQIYFLIYSLMFYFIVDKIIISWNFPIKKWFKSFLENIFYHTLLFIVCYSILYLSSQLLIRIQGNPVSFLLFYTFIIILIWQIWSFFDNSAKDYELEFRNRFFSKSKENELYCSHCHSPLSDVIVMALLNQDTVYCSHCGGKIMKNEIYQPSRQEILREHQKIIQKIEEQDNDYHIYTVNP
ncbi:hypothetical protein [Candidatus Harpocratesius sp.]